MNTTNKLTHDTHSVILFNSAERLNLNLCALVVVVAKHLTIIITLSSVKKSAIFNVKNKKLLSAAAPLW